MFSIKGERKNQKIQTHGKNLGTLPHKKKFFVAALSRLSLLLMTSTANNNQTIASLFDCEDAHLMALHLLKQAQSKLGPVYDAIDGVMGRSDDQSNLAFRKSTWKKSLMSAREWKHSADSVDDSLKPLYKSCLTFYIRSVLLRDSQRAVPKFHHFVKRFFAELIDSYDMQTGNFFERFGHQDQLSATRAAMRLALNKICSCSRK